MSSAAPAGDGTVALRTIGVTKSFQGLEVLRGVDLSVTAGTLHAVIGPNGAGKTTLFNILSGAIPPTSGKVELRGRDVTGLAPHQLTRLGLSRSFQVTSVFPKLTVEENLTVAAMAGHPRQTGILRRPPWTDAVARRVEVLLDQLGLAPMRRLEAGVLSHGDQRRLDLGLTLASEPAIILLDEPTAGMTRAEAHQTMETLERVLSGRTIVLVEHDMDLVMRISSRVSCLHRGVIIADGPPDEVRENPEVREAYLVGVGREEVILQIEGLQAGYGKSTALHGIDLEVAEGEVAALLGRNGSGRSTTLKAIMGICPPRAGRVCFNGTEIAGWEPYKIARAGIAYVPEDRRVFANLTVAENLGLAAMRGKAGYWTPEKIGEVFPILTERARQPARTLSGGQQQMLAIGRALAANPGLILLDEPLEGLAPSVALTVEDAILALKERGTTMLLVEHNSEMALRVADRGSILELGTVVASGTATELSADTALVHRYLAV